MVNLFRGSKGVLRVVEWVVEYFNDQHEDEDKDEGRVEVRDIEGGAEASNEGVSANDSSQEHGSQFRAKIFHQAVENSSASDGEGHHDDQVGEECESAEHQMSPLSEPRFDHL